MNIKPDLSGWDKLGNLAYLIVKWGLIIWLTWWIIWILAIATFWITVSRFADTPEGKAIYDNNPYNHMSNGRIDPEWQKTHPIPTDAPPVETYGPPPAPVDGYSPAPSGGSDYSGECDPNDPTDPRCLPRSE